ncbi:MAG: OmpA family protein [Clostridia bacterium]|nr:OmpA family protein [Clostridia bacterium]
MNKRSRKSEPEPDNSNSWLLTYSDVITLCLTFFVLLYSFSTIDKIKWESIVMSLRDSLGVMDGSNVPITTPEKSIHNELESSLTDNYVEYQEETKKLEEIKKKLDAYLVSKGINEDVSTNIEERGIVIRLQESVLFSKGTADLYSESKKILTELALIFKEIENPIRIEGHTDNLPIHTERYPSNWELSTSRATNVLRHLIKQGLSGQQLSAVGYGEFHPIAPNDCEVNRKKNRRVDIVIIRKSLLVNEP